MKPSFAIVGCGKVGTALGVFLTRAGYRAAGFTSKSLSSAKHVAEIIQSNSISDVPWEITRNAGVVFISTPDNAIRETCDSISRNNGFADNAVVLHCSGALPSTLLSGAKRCGAFTGSMHPLQSFASVDIDDNPFKGIVISIEGEKQAVDVAEDLATDLGGTAVTIPTAAKTLYHASAVTASNYLVTLLDLALRLITAAGISEQDAFKALKPLIEGTLSNIETVGILQALTGPIARGDVEIVEKHVEEMGATLPEFLSLYKALGFATIDIASRRGTISESCAQALKKITSP
ncbi:MAG: DUF2520 domain-containing protein [Deltaproteobacteria bacterium]|nr:DUF2520 domain-containing protein [Deltaproteobacteria bacterium]